MNTALAAAVVAAVAAAAAVCALIGLLVLRRRLAALRRAQQAVVAGGSQDIVDFTVSLQTRIDDLRAMLDELAGGLTRLDRRIDSAVTNTAVVRFDAYADAGGQQSASFAFLDTTRTGTVVTAIQGRDYARIYVKELDRGTPSATLSPEEQQAVERAMAR